MLKKHKPSDWPNVTQIPSFLMSSTTSKAPNNLLLTYCVIFPFYYYFFVLLIVQFCLISFPYLLCLYRLFVFTWFPLFGF